MLKKILKTGLYIVSTPIGNLSDITLRAIDTLNKVDLIACEDTRVSRILLKHYNITTPTMSIHNYNESSKIDFIKTKLEQGFCVALISDAGTPLISDPGYKLVSTLKRLNFYVTIIPGVSSPIAALTLAGFPTNKFTFIGFIPTKQQEKLNLFNNIKYNESTIIFFETANRLINTLEIINQIFVTRHIAIARELTKIHEEVKEGTAKDLLNYFINNNPKGEIVGLISPYTDLKIKDINKIQSAINSLSKYMSLKDISVFLSSMFEISKKEIYNIGIELKGKQYDKK